jgi:cytochrome c peroxidase
MQRSLSLTGPNPPLLLLHPATEVGANPGYAARSATAATSRVPMYRTTPLRALCQHAPYFHDGSAATLDAVVQRYEGVFRFTLTPEQRMDLIEFLKSL